MTTDVFATLTAREIGKLHWLRRSEKTTQFWVARLQRKVSNEARGCFEFYTENSGNDITLNVAKLLV